MCENRARQKFKSSHSCRPNPRTESQINLVSLFCAVHIAAMSAQQNFAAVFPEGLSPLAQADPEVFGIIKDEEERQWWVVSSGPALLLAGVCWWHWSLGLQATVALILPAGQWQICGTVGTLQEGHRAHCQRELHQPAGHRGPGIVLHEQVLRGAARRALLRRQ